MLHSKLLTFLQFAHRECQQKAYRNSLRLQGASGAHARIITSSILKRPTARSAWGMLAGMMIICPATTR